VSGGIVAGRIYKFKYRARNIFDWGEFSEQGNVLAASEPVKIDPVVITLVGTDVKIAWVPNDENGSPVEEYRINIQTSDPAVYETELTFCDGSESTIFSNNYCLIPMEVFSNPVFPFQLSQGDLIVAKVEAKNQIGWSNLSNANSDGQRVEIKPPATPADLIVNLDETDETQITVIMTELTTAEEVGGSPIVSYSLEWD